MPGIVSLRCAANDSFASSSLDFLFLDLPSPLKILQQIIPARFNGSISLEIISPIPFFYTPCVCQYGTIAKGYGKPLKDNLLQCDIPSLESGNYTLILKFMEIELQAGTLEAKLFPTVDEIFPKFATAGHDFTLTILGHNFDRKYPLQLSFEGTLTGSDFISSSQLRCVLPWKNSQKRSFLIEYALFGYKFHQTQIISSPYKEFPKIIKCFPSTGSIHGKTLVELVVSNLSLHAMPAKCVFGSDEVEATRSSETSIVCMSPPGTEGVVQIYIKDSRNQLSVDDIRFAYYGIPGILSIAPSALCEAQSIRVSIFGVGFWMELPKCKLGSCLGRAKVLNSSFALCFFAYSSCLQDKQYKLSISFNSKDFYPSKIPILLQNPPKLISAVRPYILFPGATLTIIGDGFHPTSTTSEKIQVILGNISMSGSLISEHHIVCKIPDAQMAVSSLYVMYMGCASNKLDLRLRISIQIDSVQPSLANAGSILTVTGKEFDFKSVLHCKIGIRNYRARIITSTQLFCPSPLKIAGTQLLWISDKSTSSVQLAGGIEFLPEMRIIAVYPTIVHNNKESNMLVSGINFTNAFSLNCKFGSVSVNAQYLTSSLLLCNIKSHYNDSANSTISLWHESQELSNEVSVGIVHQVLIQNVSHYFVSSNLVVLVTGLGFNQQNFLKCCVSDSICVESILKSTNQVQCDLTFYHFCNRLKSLYMIDSNGEIVSNKFRISLFNTYMTHVFPGSGTVHGGQLVSLFGQYFWNMNISVRFSAKPAVTTFVSSTLLICTLPPHPPGPSLVSLYYNSTLVELKETIVFTYHNPPRILRVYPDVVVTSRSQVITVTGEDFVPSA
eukprot:766050-Hanusia_phi.AAC.3